MSQITLSKLRIFFFSLSILSTLAACSITPQNPLTDDQKAWLLSGEALFGKEANNIALPDAGFLQLNKEMQTLAQKIAPEYQTNERRIKALLKKFRNPDSLKFEYSEERTLSASEAFKEKKGNCLSFSALIISLAREMGIKAKFNEVETPLIWEQKDDNSFILYKHINVYIKQGFGKKGIIDISRGIYQTQYPQKTISDKKAEAQFYNNRAMEYLGGKNIFKAFTHIKKALELSPKSSYLWSNLGTLYKHEQLYPEAENSFLYALQKDPKNIAAISSLQRLYLKTDQLEKANRMNEKVEQVRLKNPYYRYQKAIIAFKAKNYSLSLHHLKYALDMHPYDHQFYFLQGLVLINTGNKMQGKESMLKAIELSDNKKLTSIYQQKLDQIRERE